MEIFVGKRGSSGQERIGPLSSYSLKEQLESGEISGDDLGWFRGMSEWIPLREIESLKLMIQQVESARSEAVPESQSDEGETSPPPIPQSDPRQEEFAKKLAEIEQNATRVNPFRRGFARMFDYCFLGLVMIAIFQPMEADPTLSWSEQWQKSMEFNQSEAGRDFQIYYLVAMLAWAPIEALLLSMFGTTPGKAIFGLYVQVKDSGTRDKRGILPDFFPALGRSLGVWLIGYGAGLPLFTMVTMTFGFFQLMTKGSVLWDRKYGTEVVLRPPTIWRFVLAIALFLSLLLLSQLAIPASA